MTDEEIARKVVEKAVRWEWNDFHGIYQLFISDYIDHVNEPRRRSAAEDTDADAHADEIRVAILPVILDAIRESRKHSVPPDGMSEERLAEIGRIDQGWRDTDARASAQGVKPSLCVVCVRDLLAEVDRLRAALHAVMCEPEGECYASGYQAGKRAGAAQQKAACEKAADGAATFVGGHDYGQEAVEAARLVAEAVEGVPLVTDKEVAHADE